MKVRVRLGFQVAGCRALSIGIVVVVVRVDSLVSEPIMNASDWVPIFIPFTHVIALLAFDKLTCVPLPWLVIRTSFWRVFKRSGGSLR